MGGTRHSDSKEGMEDAIFPLKYNCHFSEDGDFTFNFPCPPKTIVTK